MASPTAKPNRLRVQSDLAQGRDLLAEVCRLGSHRYDLPETFEALLGHLRRVLRVDLLTLALVDEQKNTIRLRYSRASDLLAANLPLELALNDTPSGTAWSTQEPVLINEVANERRWPDLL